MRFVIYCHIQDRDIIDLASFPSQYVGPQLGPTIQRDILAYIRQSITCLLPILHSKAHRLIAELYHLPDRLIAQLYPSLFNSFRAAKSVLLN